MANCATRIPSSTTISSNGSRCGVSGNGESVGARSNASTSSLSSKRRNQLDKEKYLMKKLNLAGRNMHELQSLLLHESILTGNPLDSCLEPLVSRYSDQISVADSILKSTKASGTSSEPSKEKYHYYLEELQDFDWGKSQYDDFMNSTMLDNPQFTTFEKPEISAGSCAKIMPLSLSKSAKEMDETNDPNCPRPSSSTTSTSSKTFCKSLEASSSKLGANDKHGMLNRTPQRMENLSSSESIELTSMRTYSEDGEEENFNEVMSEDVMDAHKCKVLRKKQKSTLCRPRMQDVFPAVEEFETSSSSSLHQALNHSAGDSFLQESTGSPWANKSRSANESWYEFKERCSTKSLQQRLRSSESTTRMMEDTNLPFKLQDYIPEHASSPHRKSTKSVHFSSDSNMRQDRMPYSDSSSTDDDNLAFEVQQFPCTDNRRQKFQRLKSNGRVRLQK